MKQTHNINLYRHKYKPIFTTTTTKMMITSISCETARKKVRDDKDKKHKSRVCYSDTKQIEKKYSINKKIIKYCIPGIALMIYLQLRKAG